MNIDQVIASIRDIPDFPKSGILFKDITTAMKDPEVLRFIVDDLLATGGSAAAALQLLSKFDIKSLLVSFMIELEFLNGRSKLKDVADIHAMIKF